MQQDDQERDDARTFDQLVRRNGMRGAPAVQAGLATRRFTFREVFVCLRPSLLVSIGAITYAVPSRLPTARIVDDWRPE